ncbi:MAG: FKBP-type peptidyl-prolyl cis-trans isomerase [Lentisphaeria bacterium]|nr:FKBP-type peptidyl-prolyl cis-trans isomerase [Lentisphaeria bacterium]
MNLDSDLAKQSYALGQQVGSDIARLGAELDADIFAGSVAAALQGEERLLSVEEINETLQKLSQTLQSKEQEAQAGVAVANAEAGKAFLEENGKKDDVTTTASGLQYKVVKSGSGKTPSATDQVTTNYEGRLISGEVFDSSYKRGTPATFPVNGVIQGWVEALQLMKEGDEWELYIPGDLAYGQRGSAPAIGPNATLIFKIELISVN